MGNEIATPFFPFCILVFILSPDSLLIHSIQGPETHKKVQEEKKSMLNYFPNNMLKRCKEWNIFAQESKQYACRKLESKAISCQLPKHILEEPNWYRHLQYFTKSKMNFKLCKLTDSSSKLMFSPKVLNFIKEEPQGCN